jgi:acetyltransferase-like isoleucine patch superfamily enzyme
VFRRLQRRLLARYYTWSVRRHASSCGDGLRVNGPSRVTRTTRLGRNVNFNGMRITGHGQVTIGDNFHSGEECAIISEIHNYEGDAIPYDAKYLPRDVSIEDNVWIGFHVIILGGVTIGEGAIIQAGSVVVRSIPACAIAGGHPALVFSSRDRDHYEQLKRDGRFL